MRFVLSLFSDWNKIGRISLSTAMGSGPFSSPLWVRDQFKGQPGVRIYSRRCLSEIIPRLVGVEDDLQDQYNNRASSRTIIDSGAILRAGWVQKHFQDQHVNHCIE